MISAPHFRNKPRDTGDIRMSLKEFVDTLPDYAKDLRLNMGSLLSDQVLGDQRKYGLLLACAHGTGYKPIVVAAEAEVDGKLSSEAADAPRAAAATPDRKSDVEGKGVAERVE